MQIRSWMARLSRCARRGQRKSPDRSYRDDLFPALFVRQLEDRRVLNASPLTLDPALEPITLDAGAWADDGAADTFQVARQGDDLRVSVNGADLFVGRLDDVGSLVIRGSGDADTLLVDFSGGNPMPGGGIVFNGMGHPADAQDCLVIDGGALGRGIDTVTHQLQHVGDGLIQITSADQAPGTEGSTIVYTDVEAIRDLSAANQIALELAPDTPIATLSDDATPGDGRSLLTLSDGTSVLFTSPAESLLIDTRAAGPQTINVEGLDSAFRADVAIRGDADDTVNLLGDVDLGGKDLSVEAGSIRVDASVTSHAATVHLDAGPDGTSLVYGRIDVAATSPGQSGGTVHLFGGHVGLAGDALIDASGDAGGGTILVGGDYQGANPDVANAARVYVGSGVTLRADALREGNGGTVIVWADEVTRYYGHVSVRGGLFGGNAGFVEVSGLGGLAFDGTVDLAAPRGTAGRLLLDPDTLNIVEVSPGTLDGGFAGTVDFTDGGATESISMGAIEAIAAGTVILRARQTINIEDLNATVGDGSIDLQNDVSIQLETRNSVTDGDAAGGIFFADAGNSIVATGTGSITLHAGVGGNLYQADLGNLGILTTQNGNIELTANGTAALNGAISTTDGSITVTTTSMLAVNAAITAGGTGTIDLTAGGAHQTFTLLAGASIDTDNQAITITADHMNLAGATATIGNDAELVTLRQFSATTTVEFVADATADVAGILRLDDVDLDALANVNGVTVIGRDDGGDITVVEAFTLTNDTGVLHLRTGGGLSGAGQTIGVADLAVTAGRNTTDDAVVVQTAVDTTSVAVEIQRRSLTADTASGSDVVDVDTTGIQAGDRISIADDDGVTELFTVQSVDTATQLTLSAAVANDYTLGHNAFITLDVDVTIVEAAGQGDLTIGTVNGVSGITGTSGAISVSTTDAGSTLTVAQPVGLNTIAIGAGVAASVTAHGGRGR